MNIIEYFRTQIIHQLFSTNTFANNFPSWYERINEYAPNRTPNQILNLGDHLSDIFQSTGTGTRNQSAVSAGGSAWEALICWYLNLCLVGRRTIVIKHNKNFIPTPVSNAITVNYGNFKSNTESDLIAITFPNLPEYSIDFCNINIVDANGMPVPIATQDLESGRHLTNTKQLLDALAHRDFRNIEIHIIQTKTNWNDNAQIPMLWDAIYAANNFRNGISVGCEGYSIHDALRFTYSFVTVPTNDLDNYKVTSTPVLRVKQLSGGNYWGRPTQIGIASSLKEMLERNLKHGANESILTTIQQAEPYFTGSNVFYFIPPDLQVHV